MENTQAAGAWVWHGGMADDLGGDDVAAEAFPADPAGWRAALIDHGFDAGNAESLGPDHFAVFVDEGTTLIVTFEEAGEVRARLPGRVPEGLALARPRGWSWLGIIAQGPTWWRDPAVWRYVDRLVDDAFFEDFDRVLFLGAGMGGYAAAAYSVAAPGAAVLLAAPQATLAPGLAAWDGRFRAARRRDFSTRYAFAPDMTEGAGRVHLIFDPAEREDAMHAALFHRPWCTLLPARRIGAAPWTALRAMGLTGLLAEAAMEGRLDPATFARAWRTRRVFGPYLRRMLALSETAGHPARAAMVCRSVTARLKAPFFRRRLAELEASLPAQEVR